MENSILNSVKKMLGVHPDYNHFDADILMHINTVLVILSQIGVRGDKPLIVSSEWETWDELFEGDPRLELIKSYVYLKVRSLFDPPTVGAVAEAMNASISELEWRISVTVDPVTMNFEENQNA